MKAECQSSIPVMVLPAEAVERSLDLHHKNVFPFFTQNLYQSSLSFKLRIPGVRNARSIIHFIQFLIFNFLFRLNL